MADILDILGTIGRGAGIAASDLLGITEKRREARERELEEQRLRAVLEQIKAQTEASREALAAGKRTEQRNVIADLGEQLRSRPDAELAAVGTTSDELVGADQGIANVERSEATDSLGRPIDVVTGSTIASPDVQALTEQTIAGADMDPAEVLRAAGARARFAEEGQEKERKEALSWTLLENVSTTAATLGFYDFEAGEANIESAMDYLADEREFKKRYDDAKLENLQVSTQQMRSSMANAKAHLDILRDKMAKLEPATQQQILQKAGRMLTGQARMEMRQNPKLSQAEAYDIAVMRMVDANGADPELGGLFVTLGSQIQTAFDDPELRSAAELDRSLGAGPTANPEIRRLMESGGFDELSNLLGLD